MADDSDQPDFDPAADAESLAEAERIKADPMRHSRALAHTARQISNTYKSSRQALEAKVRKRSAQIFGARKPPFEEAEGDQTTPFTEAGSGGSY